jgi:hypothetical protein
MHVVIGDAQNGDNEVLFGDRVSVSRTFELLRATLAAVYGFCQHGAANVEVRTAHTAEGEEENLFAWVCFMQ